MQKSLLLFLAVSISHIAAMQPVEDLYEAIQANALPRVQQLIAAGADVNHKDKYGATLLMGAAERQQIAIVRALLAAAADVNARDEVGCTAFEIAVNCGCSLELVELLIASGANACIDDVNGRINLMAKAAELSNTKLLDTLLAVGYDVNTRGGVGGMTPLMCVSINGSLDGIRTLLRVGADVNRQSIGRHKFAITVAAECDSGIQIINALIDAGADVNAQHAGITALALTEDKEVGIALIEAGANLYVAGDCNPKPYMITYGRMGPNIGLPTNNLRTRENRWRGDEKYQFLKKYQGIQEKCTVAVQENNIELVKEIVQMHPFTLNSPTEAGLTPLMLAAWNGNTELCAFLLSQGVNVRARNKHGVTALYYVSQIEKPELFTMIHKRSLQHCCLERLRRLPLEYRAKLVSSQDQLQMLQVTYPSLFEGIEVVGGGK
jgi:ankyrin repeat protein